MENLHGTCIFSDNVSYLQFHQVSILRMFTVSAFMYMYRKAPHSQQQLIRELLSRAQVCVSQSELIRT